MNKKENDMKMVARTNVRLDAVNELIKIYDEMTEGLDPDNIDSMGEFESLLVSTNLILKEYRDVLVEVKLKHSDFGAENALSN